MLSKRKLAEALCKLEGGKKQVNIAQMSEILKHQSMMLAEYLYDTFPDQLDEVDFDKDAPLAVIVRDAVREAKKAKKSNKK